MTTDGATVASATYEPFGEFASNDGLGATSTFPSFAGTPTDPNSGLLLMGARTYDPSVGRFLTYDPAPVSAYDPAISPYVYVNNRPTVLVDPTGLRGVSTETCPPWVCVLYFLNKVASDAEMAFSGVAVSSVAVSALAPEWAITIPWWEALAIGAGGVENGTGLAITGYDAVTGGDWKCEAGSVATGLVTAGVGGWVGDLAGPAGATRTQRRQLRETIGLYVDANGGSFIDGILGGCDRPGW